MFFGMEPITLILIAIIVIVVLIVLSGIKVIDHRQAEKGLYQESG